MFKLLVLWWTSRVRSIGRENYVRLTPNPGFRLVYGGKEIKWSRFYGWRRGRVR